MPSTSSSIGNIIGKKITVLDAHNTAQLGLEGTIINESRNMLEIETVSGTKRLIKAGIKFTVKSGNKSVAVNGKDIIGRLSERLKK